MIAIWGANGFVGRHLVSCLKGQEAQAKLFARSFDGFPFALPAGMRPVTGDFLQPEQHIHELADCRALILLVSASQARTFAGDPAQEIQHNVEPYRRFFAALARQKTDLERVVFLSSGGAVYGVTAPHPVGEDHPARPISPYGRGKLQIEASLQEFTGATGIGHTILRVANPVGLWSNGRGLVNAAFKAVKTGAPLKILGDGGAVRDYFAVTDLAEAIRKILYRETAHNQIFNVGSGKGYSINDVVRLAGDVTGADVPVAYEQAFDSDVPYNVLDCTRIYKATGWRAETGLKEIMQHMWGQA